jgi:exoribonuclease-2
VAFWDGPSLAIAVVAGEEKQRVSLILEGGRAERVPHARIAIEVERPGLVPAATHEARVAAGARARAAREKVEGLAARIDVTVLWELVKETASPETDASLADLALGRATGEERAALVTALVRDATHFVRRGDRWEPREAAAVAEILSQRSRSSEKRSARARALAALSSAVATGVWAPSGDAEERRYLEALEEVAVHDQDARETARDAALEAIEASGLPFDRPDEGAFRLLRRLGVFASDDENLAIHRYRLRRDFPEDVVSAAQRASARGFSRDRRADLTGLSILTVDDASTREIDDGLSVEALSGERRRIGVHIADPAAFVEPGDPVDREALARGITHYFPDARLPMLPGSISEDAASLLPGADRPALSFLVDVDASGDVVAFEILRSIVRSRERLDYDEADSLVTGGRRDLAELLAVADLREGRRIEAGAVTIGLPEVQPHVDGNGRVTLERRDPRSPAHRLVSEMMLLAGTVAAGYCAERGLPTIFRRQAAAEPRASRLEGAPPLVAARALRRGMKRGETGPRPGPHAGLGLPAYTQVTSPLRRFQDLVAHRQIGASLEGRPPVYDPEALQRIAAGTERAEIDGRRAERSADRYWLLRALEDTTGQLVEAVVVEREPRTVVVLVDTMLEEPLRFPIPAEIGSVLRLRIERVNPRADLVRLRPE